LVDLFGKMKGNKIRTKPTSPEEGNQITWRRTKKERPIYWPVRGKTRTNGGNHHVGEDKWEQRIRRYEVQIGQKTFPGYAKVPGQEKNTLV